MRGCHAERLQQYPPQLVIQHGPSRRRCTAAVCVSPARRAGCHSSSDASQPGPPVEPDHKLCRHTSNLLCVLISLSGGSVAAGPLQRQTRSMASSAAGCTTMLPGAPASVSYFGEWTASRAAQSCSRLRAVRDSDHSRTSALALADGPAGSAWAHLPQSSEASATGGQEPRLGPGPRDTAKGRLAAFGEERDRLRQLPRNPTRPPRLPGRHGSGRQQLRVPCRPASESRRRAGSCPQFPAAHATRPSGRAAVSADLPPPSAGGSCRRPGSPLRLRRRISQHFPGEERACKQ